MLLRRDNGLAPTTAVVLIAAIAVGLVHHIDHVLRVDHSGWPFRPDVNPFTFSLVAYPILFFALLGPRRLFWWRWAGLAIGTAFTMFAHTRIETPQMQYAMWAYNRSLEPELWDIRNLCGVQSGGLGWIAVIVAMALNVLLVVATIGMLVNGVRGQRDRDGLVGDDRG
ncbi:hypothetical protein [Sphingomonas adhaesiva]|uniref:hypothetical protein n=1 Tax=Sphingomonas adhaesiva TaxID=28212 RepID=UPI002FF8A342